MVRSHSASDVGQTLLHQLLPIVVEMARCSMRVSMFQKTSTSVRICEFGSMCGFETSAPCHVYHLESRFRAVFEGRARSVPNHCMQGFFKLPSQFSEAPGVLPAVFSVQVRKRVAWISDVFIAFIANEISQA